MGRRGGLISLLSIQGFVFQFDSIFSIVSSFPLELMHFLFWDGVELVSFKERYGGLLPSPGISDCLRTMHTTWKQGKHLKLSQKEMSSIFWESTSSPLPLEIYDR